ncbi:MAG: 3-deoxy-manno-octulosonate cytidylyltransferase [Bacteroidales bacterium]|nr:3-deoxy-manno-octulosonate cytidylyltransferase [Bacteroidales bacterium]
MSVHLRFIGIIPARYDSSRFPGKPLAEIRGKIMIRHVYEQALKALDTVYVATDDERILKAVKKFGGQVVLTSPDHRSGTDRCAEAVGIIERAQGQEFDVIINIQGDEPFIRSEQLDLIKSCFDRLPVQIATLVKPVEKASDLFNPDRPKVVVNQHGEAIYFSRFPIPFFRGKAQSEWMDLHRYYMHIGLYGYRKDILLEITKLEQSILERAESLEQLRWIENGYAITVQVTEYESFGVDTPEDLKKFF